MEIFYERHYYAFWKGVVTPFRHKRRNYYAFSLRVITPFSPYYAFQKGVITPFNFFSLRNLIPIGFRMITTLNNQLFNVPCVLMTNEPRFEDTCTCIYPIFKPTEISYFIWTSLQLISTFPGLHSIHYVKLTVEYM